MNENKNPERHRTSHHKRHDLSLVQNLKCCCVRHGTAAPACLGCSRTASYTGSAGLTWAGMGCIAGLATVLFFSPARHTKAKQLCGLHKVSQMQSAVSEQAPLALCLLLLLGLHLSSKLLQVKALGQGGLVAG